MKPWDFTEIKKQEILKKSLSLPILDKSAINNKKNNHKNVSSVNKEVIKSFVNDVYFNDNDLKQQINYINYNNSSSYTNKYQVGSSIKDLNKDIKRNVYNNHNDKNNNKNDDKYIFTSPNDNNNNNRNIILSNSMNIQFMTSKSNDDIKTLIRQNSLNIKNSTNKSIEEIQKTTQNKNKKPKFSIYHHNRNKDVINEKEYNIDDSKILTRLIVLRRRHEELKEFLLNIKYNLHRGPYCRVKKTTKNLKNLIKLCENKLYTTRNNNGKFRDEKLLQLCCELITYPETYDIIVTIIENNHKLPRNYYSDDEIERYDIIKSPLPKEKHSPINHELLRQYSSSNSTDPEQLLIDPNYGYVFNESLETLNSSSIFSKSNTTDDMIHNLLKQNDKPIIESKDFVKAKLLKSSSSYSFDDDVINDNNNNSIGGNKIKRGDTVSGDMNNDEYKNKINLDEDLKLFFVQQFHTTQLSNLGFYEDDDFLKF